MAKKKSEPKEPCFTSSEVLDRIYACYGSLTWEQNEQVLRLMGGKRKFPVSWCERVFPEVFPKAGGSL